MHPHYGLRRTCPDAGAVREGRCEKAFSNQRPALRRLPTTDHEVVRVPDEPGLQALLQPLRSPCRVEGMQGAVREQRGDRPTLRSPATRPLAALDLPLAIRPLEHHGRAQPLPEQPTDGSVAHAAGHGREKVLAKMVPDSI